MKATYQPSIGFLIVLAAVCIAITCAAQWLSATAIDCERRAAADATPFKRCANCYMPSVDHYRMGDDPSLCGRCWHEKRPLRVQITIGGGR